MITPILREFCYFYQRGEGDGQDQECLVADLMIPSLVLFPLLITLFHIYGMSALLSAEKGSWATKGSEFLVCAQQG